MTYCAGLRQDPYNHVCSPQAEQWLYAPAAWAPPEPLHAHLDDDTAKYFHDPLFGGADVAHEDGEDRGIETGRFAFYAGHGGPWGWSAGGGGTAWLDRVLLGNGEIEYLLMCSCNILAHGPACRGGSSDTCDFHYQNPQMFAVGRGFSPDGPDRRDAFFRWRSHLVGGMRLLCGGVSKSCHLATAPALMWDRYLNHCASPSDAFIGGIGNETEVLGCLAAGPRDPRKTALYEEAFGASQEPTDRAKSAGEVESAEPGEYLHLQYGVFESLLTSQGLLRALDTSPDSPPLQLPVYRLAAARPALEPSADCTETFSAPVCQAISEVVRNDPPFVWGSGPDWTVWSHRASRSVHLRGELPAPIQTDSLPRADDLVARAREYLSDLGLDGPLQRIEGVETSGVIHMLIDRAPRWVPEEEPVRFLKSSTVELRRVIRLCQAAEPESWHCHELLGRGFTGIPVLGEGGRILVELGPNKELVSLARIWRPVVTEEPLEFRSIIPLKVAIDRALDQLWSEMFSEDGKEPLAVERARVGELFRLDEASSEFGYVERSASCLQEILWPVYRLRFMPIVGSHTTVGSASVGLSPRLIEIPAMTDLTRHGCTPWVVEGGRISPVAHR